MTNLGKTIDKFPVPGGDVAFNSNKLTGVADGTSAAHAATKGQLDAEATLRSASDASEIASRISADAALQAAINALGAGLKFKASVRAGHDAGDVNIAAPASWNLGGVTLADGESIVLAAQTAGAQNGAYVRSGSALVRRTDSDTSAEVTSGTTYPVLEGTHASSLAILVTPDPITLGTTVLTFNFVAQATDFNAGAALVMTGNTLDVAVDNSTIEVSSDALRVKALGLTDAHVATANKDGAADTASLRTLGAGATQAAAGTHTHAGSAITSGTVAAARLPSLEGITAPAADVTLNSHKITSLADPANAQDAATKAYVDSIAPSGDPNMGGDIAGTASNAQIVAGAVGTSEVAAANKDGSAGTPSMRTLGAAAVQAAAGNDARLSDQRVPTNGSVTGAKLAASAADAATLEVAGGSMRVKADGIGSSQIAANAVGASELAADAVDTAAIQDGAVTGAKIAAATITDSDIAAANKDGADTSPSLRTLGVAPSQAAAGNHAHRALPRGPSFIRTTTHSGTAGWATNHTGEDITSDANANPLAPLFSLPVKQAVWENTNGVLNATTAANLDTSIELARTRVVTNDLGGGSRLSPFKIILRIYAALDGPYGDHGAPTWGTDIGIPTVALANGNQPLPWNPLYQSTVQAFMNLVASYLDGLDTTGVPKWSYVALIPMMGPTGLGTASTEMWAKYQTGDQAAWDAISGFYPSGVTSSADKELYRQRRIEEAYRVMVPAQLATFPNIHHGLGLGEMMNDGYQIATGLVVGRTVTGAFGTTSNSTLVHFTGTSLLTNGGIGATLYKTTGGAHTRLGVVTDIRNDTTVILDTAVTTDTFDTFSMELAPLDTNGHRLVVMSTDLELDTQWRHSYNFKSPELAQLLRSARRAGWPIIFQTETYTGSATGYDQKFPTNTNAAVRATLAQALRDWNPAIIEANGSIWSEIRPWMSSRLAPAMEAGASL